MLFVYLLLLALLPQQLFTAQRAALQEAMGSEALETGLKVATEAGSRFLPKPVQDMLHHPPPKGPPKGIQLPPTHLTGEQMHDLLHTSAPETATQWHIPQHEMLRLDPSLQLPPSARQPMTTEQLQQYRDSMTPYQRYLTVKNFMQQRYPQLSDIPESSWQTLARSNPTLINEGFDAAKGSHRQIIEQLRQITHGPTATSASLQLVPPTSAAESLGISRAETERILRESRKAEERQAREKARQVTEEAAPPVTPATKPPVRAKSEAIQQLLSRSPTLQSQLEATETALKSLSDTFSTTNRYDELKALWEDPKDTRYVSWFSAKPTAPQPELKGELAQVQENIAAMQRQMKELLDSPTTTPAQAEQAMAKIQRLTTETTDQLAKIQQKMPKKTIEYDPEGESLAQKFESLQKHADALQKSNSELSQAFKNALQIPLAGKKVPTGRGMMSRFGRKPTTAYFPLNQAMQGMQLREPIPRPIATPSTSADLVTVPDSALTSASASSMSQQEALDALNLTTTHPTKIEINQAYKKLASQLHPDMPHGDKSLFQKILEAKETLLDPPKTLAKGLAKAPLQIEAQRKATEALKQATADETATRATDVADPEATKRDELATAFETATKKAQQQTLQRLTQETLDLKPSDSSWQNKLQQILQQSRNLKLSQAETAHFEDFLRAEQNRLQTAQQTSVVDAESAVRTSTMDELARAHKALEEASRRSLKTAAKRQAKRQARETKQRQELTKTADATRATNVLDPEATARETLKQLEAQGKKDAMQRTHARERTTATDLETATRATGVVDPEAAARQALEAASRRSLEKARTRQAQRQARDRKDLATTETSARTTDVVGPEATERAHLMKHARQLKDMATRQAHEKSSLVDAEATRRTADVTTHEATSRETLRQLEVQGKKDAMQRTHARERTTATDLETATRATGVVDPEAAARKALEDESRRLLQKERAQRQARDEFKKQYDARTAQLQHKTPTPATVKNPAIAREQFLEKSRARQEAVSAAKPPTKAVDTAKLDKADAFKQRQELLRQQKIDARAQRTKEVQARRDQIKQARSQREATERTDLDASLTATRAARQADLLRQHRKLLETAEADRVDAMQRTHARQQTSVVDAEATHRTADVTTHEAASREALEDEARRSLQKAQQEQAQREAREHKQFQQRKTKLARAEARTRTRDVVDLEATKRDELAQAFKASRQDALIREASTRTATPLATPPAQDTAPARPTKTSTSSGKSPTDLAPRAKPPAKKLPSLKEVQDDPFSQPFPTTSRETATPVSAITTPVSREGAQKSLQLKQHSSPVTKLPDTSTPPLPTTVQLERPLATPEHIRRLQRHMHMDTHQPTPSTSTALATVPDTTLTPASASSLSRQEALDALHLPANPTRVEIRDAYKRAAVINHPDKNPEGRQLFELAQAAYEQLMNPPAKGSAQGPAKAPLQIEAGKPVKLPAVQEKSASVQLRKPRSSDRPSTFRPIPTETVETPKPPAKSPVQVMKAQDFKPSATAKPSLQVKADPQPTKSLATDTPRAPGKHGSLQLRATPTETARLAPRKTAGKPAVQKQPPSIARIEDLPSEGRGKPSLQLRPDKAGDTHTPRIRQPEGERPSPFGKRFERREQHRRSEQQRRQDPPKGKQPPEGKRPPSGESAHASRKAFGVGAEGMHTVLADHDVADHTPQVHRMIADKTHEFNKALQHLNNLHEQAKREKAFLDHQALQRQAQQLPPHPAAPHPKGQAKPDVKQPVKKPAVKPQVKHDDTARQRKRAQAIGGAALLGPHPAYYDDDTHRRVIPQGPGQPGRNIPPAKAKKPHHRQDDLPHMVDEGRHEARPKGHHEDDHPHQAGPEAEKQPDGIDLKDPSEQEPKAKDPAAKQAKQEAKAKDPAAKQAQQKLEDDDELQEEHPPDKKKKKKKRDDTQLPDRTEEQPDSSDSLQLLEDDHHHHDPSSSIIEIKDDEDAMTHEYLQEGLSLEEALLLALLPDLELLIESTQHKHQSRKTSQSQRW